MTGKPDGEDIRWNNTTLSSLAGTCFLRALGMTLDKTERAEWSEKRVRKGWRVQKVRFYVANGPKGVNRSVRHLPKSRVSVVEGSDFSMTSEGEVAFWFDSLLCPYIRKRSSGGWGTSSITKTDVIVQQKSHR